MTKLIAVLALFSIGCGQTDCDKYLTVYCQKAGTCGYNIDGAIVRPEQSECEAAGRKSLTANDITEEQCVAAKTQIQGMSCAQFQAFAAN